MSNATTHWLRFELHMDEAQMTGKAFQPSVDGATVTVWDTYNFPEYEEMWSDRKVMSVADARALWVKLLTENNDDGYGRPIWTRK